MFAPPPQTVSVFQRYVFYCNVLAILLLLFIGLFVCFTIVDNPNAPLSDPLFQAEVTVFSDRDCSRLFDIYATSEIVYPINICAGGNGKDTCLVCYFFY